MSPHHLKPSALRGAFFVALLAIGVTFIFSCLRDSDASHLDSSPCVADINGDQIVDILDTTSFLAPVRRLDHSPPDPEYDAKWDVVPGPGVFSEWINIQDLTMTITHKGWCETDVQFYSKISTDTWWPQGQPEPGIINQYEMIHHWECCQRYPQAFNGPAMTYVDFYLQSNGNIPYFPALPNTPSWILGGNCLQAGFGDRYIGDFSNASFRSALVGAMVNLVNNTDTDGIYIDVAEAWRDAATSCTNITQEAHLQGWTDLVEAFNAALPNAPFVVNFQPARWFLVRDLNPTLASRFFKAVDMVEIEHGWTLSNSNANSFSGWNDQIAKIDYIHSLGTGVFTWEYAEEADQCEDMTSQQETYSLAMWLITRGPEDMYGTYSNDGRECGDNFSVLYSKDLGQPQARISCGSGCVQRVHAQGTVSADFNTKTGVIP